MCAWRDYSVLWLCTSTSIAVFPSIGLVLLSNSRHAEIMPKELSAPDKISIRYVGMGCKLRLCTRKYRDCKSGVLRSSRLANRKINEPVSSHLTSESTLLSIHSAIQLPPSWFDHTTTSNLDCICICKVFNHSSQCKPPVITHTIIIQGELLWTVHVHDHDVSKCPALSLIPQHLRHRQWNF